MYHIFLLPEAEVYRDDVHVPFVLKSILFETKHYIISELIDRLVVHIFNKQSQLAVFYLSGALCAVAHFDSSV